LGLLHKSPRSRGRFDRGLVTGDTAAELQFGYISTRQDDGWITGGN
jgi:hypothetical protein